MHTSIYQRFSKKKKLYVAFITQKRKKDMLKELGVHFQFNRWSPFCDD